MVSTKVWKFVRLEKSELVISGKTRGGWQPCLQRDVKGIDSEALESIYKSREIHLKSLASPAHSLILEKGSSSR